MLAFARGLFYCTLLARMVFHMKTAVDAYNDLQDLQSATSDPALSRFKSDDIVKDLEFSFTFYTVCGPALLVLAFLYAWTYLTAGRTVSAISVSVHALFVGFVFYAVFLHTVNPFLCRLRAEYRAMKSPSFFAVSLALDVFTSLSFWVHPVTKNPAAESADAIFVLARERTIAGNFNTLPSLVAAV